MKKSLLVFAAALLALSLMLTGCAANAPVSAVSTATATAEPTATTEPTATAEPTATTEPTAEAQAVSAKPGMLATINGEDIPIDEALDEYAYYEAIYTMYGMSDQLEQLKQEIAEYYVSLELIYLQYAELGFETDMDAVKATAQANYDEAVQSYTTYVTDDTLSEEETLKAAETMLIEEGYGLDYFEKIAYNEARLVAVLEHYTKDITATEEDVKAYYEELVASDKALYESNIAYYEQANSYGERVMYVPEGFRRVKHILVTLSDEAQTELSDLQDQLDSVENELTKEGADTAALNTKKAEIEKEIDEIFAVIDPKTEEILSKLAAGEDFIALMEEYGEDPGMQSEPYATEGYLVHADSTQWVTEFRDAAVALEQIGDVSQPVRTSYGLHIIRYEGDVESGAVDYDSVKDELMDEVQDTLMNSYYNDLIDQWRAEAEIVMYLENFDIAEE